MCCARRWYVIRCTRRDGDEIETSVLDGLAQQLPPKEGGTTPLELMQVTLQVCVRVWVRVRKEVLVIRPVELEGKRHNYKHATPC